MNKNTILRLVCVGQFEKKQSICVCVCVCLTLFSAVETVRVVLCQQKAYWKSLAYCGNYFFLTVTFKLS